MALRQQLNARRVQNGNDALESTRTTDRPSHPCPAGGRQRRSGSDLHDVVALAELEQVDDGVFALSSDAGVLVFGVVQQTLYQGLDQAHLQRGRLRVFPHPPQHPLRDQSDVAGLVLKTLGGAGEVTETAIQVVSLENV